MESVPSSVQIEMYSPDAEAIQALFMPDQQPVDVRPGTESDDPFIGTIAGGVQFGTQFGEYIHRLALMIDDRYDAAHYAGPNYNDDGSYQRALELKDLPFMSREEADRLARDRLLALGVEAGVRLDRVYTLDKTRLQFFMDLFEMEFVYNQGPTGWTDEDACYVLQYQLEAFGLPLETDNYEHGKQHRYRRHRTYVVISASGFELMNVQGLFRTVSAEESASVLSPDAALDLFVRKFQAYPPKKELLLTKMQLRYVWINASGDDALVPMWRFLTPDETEYSDFFAESWTSFNAITGKEE